MRELQYILNVLGYANLLNKDSGKPSYSFPGVDPFYIEDREWQRMKRAFDEKFLKGGGHENLQAKGD